VYVDVPEEVSEQCVEGGELEETSKLHSMFLLDNSFSDEFADFPGDDPAHAEEEDHMGDEFVGDAV
jgi:hypothetical protein